MKKKLILLIPEPLRKALRPVRDFFVGKSESELSYWQQRFKETGGKFKNSHYKKNMLAMAEEINTDFLKNKIVADFGCGPCGSLTWADTATARIGIDVLADRYVDAFPDNATTHNMIYLKSTEKTIPLPSDSVDVMFTINAIDHVDNFEIICNEIIRVLKPGGYFIGSFNLEEPPASCEPQQLTEKLIKENLLDKLEIISYKLAHKGKIGNQYAPMIAGDPSYKTGDEGFLWARARKQP
jgi:SAM-dependent methyltransferase